MALNWEVTHTQNFVDQEHKMMLCQNAGWNVDGDNGKGDSIGRTFDSYICYRDERFIEGIESCWERKERNWFWKLLGKKYYYQGYRYPVEHENLKGLSRDHVSYTILAYKYAGYSNEELKEFIKHLRFKISDFALFTIDMWLWARALCGSKFYTWLYYTIEIPVLKISRWKNRRIYKKAPFEDECHQDAWVKIQNELKPERIKKLAKKLYPVYALHNLSWQISLLPDSKRKKKLQKICLDICPKHNYAIKILLGFKNLVSRDDVMNYKAMRGGRWSGILNPWINDRDLDKITDQNLITDNVLDVDYIIKLYNTIEYKCIPIEQNI